MDIRAVLEEVARWCAQQTAAGDPVAIEVDCHAAHRRPRPTSQTALRALRHQTRVPDESVRPDRTPDANAAARAAGRHRRGDAGSRAVDRGRLDMVRAGGWRGGGPGHARGALHGPRLRRGPVATWRPHRGPAENLGTTARATIDLGGGPLGSSGGNCLDGGSLAAALVRYDVTARGNWWGQPGGPAPGRAVATGGTLDSAGALDSAPPGRC